MLAIDLFDYVFSRIIKTGEALFSQDEVAAWPVDLTHLLTTHNILQETQPAKIIECKGCEEYCFMPVQILQATHNMPARAFIVCDKRDDTNRVSVDVKRLSQWQATSESLACCLTKLVCSNQITPQKINDKKWRLTVLQGKKHKSFIILVAEDTFKLSIAGHLIPLIEVLDIQEKSLVLNKNKLLQCVDKPVGSEETAADRSKRLKARIKEEKTKGTRAFLQTVAQEEGISVQRLKQITQKKNVTRKANDGFSRIDD